MMVKRPRSFRKKTLDEDDDTAATPSAPSTSTKKEGSTVAPIVGTPIHLGDDEATSASSSTSEYDPFSELEESMMKGRGSTNSSTRRSTVSSSIKPTIKRTPNASSTSTVSAPATKLSGGPTQKLLSFGDEAEEEEEDSVVIKPIVKKDSARRSIRKPSLDDEGATSTGSRLTSAYFSSTAGQYTSDELENLRKNTKSLPRAKSSESAPQPVAPPTAATQQVSEQQEQQPTTSIATEKPPNAIIEIPDEIEDDVSETMIYDAAAIKKARERRERLRRYAGDNGEAEREEGFIPLRDTSSAASDKEGSRLVREEEDDQAEEAFDDYGSRIRFGDPGRSKTTIDSSSRSEVDRMFSSFGGEVKLHRAGDYDEEEDDEVQRWEMEMIKKGGGASSVLQDEKGGKAAIKQLEEGLSKTLNKERRELEQVIQAQIPSPEELQKELMRRLKLMEEQESKARATIDVIQTQKKESADRIKALEKDLDDASNQYVFFQEIQDYIDNLVSCLSQKMPEIKSLEDELASLYNERYAEVNKRNQDDDQDEFEEAGNYVRPGSFPSGPTGELDELGRDKGLIAANDKKRRKEERRARREELIVKRQTRPKERSDEGWTSEEDDETETENNARQRYYSAREDILQRAHTVFDDTDPEYSSITVLKTKLESWKKHYPRAYRRALVSHILPELFSPYIQLQLLEWEPLEEDRKDSAPFFTSMEWYEQLYDYGPIESSSNPNTPKDEDAFLIPNIVKLIIIPRLRALFTQGGPFVPLSRKHNQRARNLLRDVSLFFPGNTTYIKEQLLDLIENQLKIASAELRVPVFPSAPPGSIAYQYPWRQFWRCVKLMSILTQWHKVLSLNSITPLFITLMNDKVLKLFQRLPGLALGYQVEVCRKIADNLDKDWIAATTSSSATSKTRESLEEFRFFVVSLERTLHLERDRETKARLAEQISSILETIQDKDTATLFRRKHLSE